MRMSSHHYVCGSSIANLCHSTYTTTSSKKKEEKCCTYQAKSHNSRREIIVFLQPSMTCVVHMYGAVNGAFEQMIAERGHHHALQNTSLVNDQGQQLEVGEQDGIEPSFYSITRVQSLSKSILVLTCSSLNGITLSLPYLFIQSGLVGGMTLNLLIAVFSSVSLRYLHDCSRAVHGISYTEIVYKLLGEQYRIIFSLIFYFSLLSLLVGVAALIGRTVTQLVLNVLVLVGHNQEAIAIISVHSNRELVTVQALSLMLALLPLSPALLSVHLSPYIHIYVIASAMLAIPALVVVLIILTLTSSVSQSTISIGPQSGLAFFEALALSLPIFMNHFSFLTVSSELQCPTRERVLQVIMLSQCLLLGIALLVEISGVCFLQMSSVLSYDSSAPQHDLNWESNILEVLPCVMIHGGGRGMLVTVALLRVVVLFLLLSCVPTLFIPTRSMLEDVLLVLRERSHNWDAQYVMQFLRQSIHRRKPKSRTTNSTCSNHTARWQREVSTTSNACRESPSIINQGQKMSQQALRLREVDEPHLIREESCNDNDEGQAMLQRRSPRHALQTWHHHRLSHSLFVDAISSYSSPDTVKVRPSAVHWCGNNGFGFAGGEWLWVRYEHGGELPQNKLVNVFSRMNSEDISVTIEELPISAYETEEVNEVCIDRTVILDHENAGKKSIRRVCLTIFLTIFMILGSIALDGHVFLLWECVGSLFCPWIMFIIPSVCFIKMELMRTHFRNSHPQMSKRVLAAFMMCILGFCIFVSCSFRTALKIVNNQ